MYKSYSFWRDHHEVNKVISDPVIQTHEARPIYITNTQKIVITRDNIKSFLEEGERAKMQRLMQENGVPEHKFEAEDTKDPATDEGTKQSENEDSTLSLPDSETIDSMNEDVEEMSLEEAKEKLTKYNKILSMFLKMELNKLNIIISLISEIYDGLKEELEDFTAEIKLLDSLQIILKYYEEKSANDVDKPTDDGYDIVTLILAVLSDLTDLSATYSKMVMQAGVIHSCAKLTQNPNFVKNHENSEQMIQILDGAITVIHNCIRHVPGEPLYEKENIKQVVEPYLSSNVNVLRVLSIMIISALISEDENTKMEHAGAIPYMVQSFGISLMSADKRYNGFAATEFLECLIRIAANDSNKVKIIEAGILPGLVTVLNEGEDQDKILSAKLLWVLCFDEDAKTKVVEEPGCLNALKEHSKSVDSEIKRMANGALWKIQGEDIYQEKHRIEDKPVDEKHIFISYQWDHQKMVLKVKDRLKASGFKVWIDVEQMGGSTLESMANAVENAKVVLVCASEKYKISPNCRTEAEYIFQLKKPIVPLMLQRYYKADGWLGMLLGAKFFVNFDGKYEFDYAYGLLLKELQKFTNGDSAVSIKSVDVNDGAGVPTFTRPISARSSAHTTRLELKCKKWNSQQVEEWVAENKLYSFSSKLEGLFENMDGESLVHLLRLKKEAPDYFYKELKTEYDMNLSSIVQLMKVFDTLLKKR